MQPRVQTTRQNNTTHSQVTCLRPLDEATAGLRPLDEATETRAEHDDTRRRPQPIPSGRQDVIRAHHVIPESRTGTFGIQAQDSRINSSDQRLRHVFRGGLGNLEERITESVPPGISAHATCQHYCIGTEHSAHQDDGDSVYYPLRNGSDSHSMHQSPAPVPQQFTATTTVTHAVLHQGAGRTNQVSQGGGAEGSRHEPSTDIPDLKTLNAKRLWPFQTHFLCFLN